MDSVDAASPLSSQPPDAVTSNATSARPHALTVPPSPASSSPSPSSPRSPSSSSPESPSSPLIITAADFSSLLTLKHDYDALLVSHHALLASSSRSAQRRQQDDADIAARMQAMQDDHRRLMRDYAEESELRRTSEEKEDRSRREVEDERQQRQHRDGLLQLTTTQLETEKAVVQLLKRKLDAAEAKETERSERQEQETEKAGEEEPGAGRRRAGGGVLQDVEIVVLRRRVQRLELELEESRRDVTQQRDVNQQHAQRLQEVWQQVQSITAAADRPQSAAVREAARDESEETLAGLELVLLKELLQTERVQHCRRERRLLCLALLWLLSLLTVCLSSLSLLLP